MDSSCFLLDPDLVIRDAEGVSVMRLPWFDPDLFVGRPVPDITEVPVGVRETAVPHYRAALRGESGRFAFSSYGHAFTVDCTPVCEDGRVGAVLATFRPDRTHAPAALRYEQVAAQLSSTAAYLRGQASRRDAAGQHAAAAGATVAARRATEAADRALVNAVRLRTGAPAVVPGLTPRELEVLTLASLGLTNSEIGDEVSASPATVKQHLDNTYRKLGCSDRTAAVATAIRHGLLD